MTWTQSNITSGYQPIRYGSGVWVDRDHYSLDGQTWYKSNSNGLYLGYKEYGNDGFVGGTTNGTNGSGIYYSRDGIIWSQTNLRTGHFTKFTYMKNGIWIAASTYNSAGLYYSTPLWEEV